jgi:hypothetical protein
MGSRLAGRAVHLAMFMGVAEAENDFEEQSCDGGSDFASGTRIYAAELQN